MVVEPAILAVTLVFGSDCLNPSCFHRHTKNAYTLVPSSARERVVAWQHSLFIAAAEMHRASVTSRDVVVWIERGDRNAESLARVSQRLESRWSSGWPRLR